MIIRYERNNHGMNRDLDNYETTKAEQKKLGS